MRDGSSLGVALFNVVNELPKNLVAFGVNCCSPKALMAAIQAIEGARKHVVTGFGWLRSAVAVYPNSGEGWDAEHRCWVGENDADHFAEHAREWIKAGANIIGGCCRTGPEHIAQLRAIVDELN